MDAQTKFFEDKLQYELDPWDLNAAIIRGEKIVVVDARSDEKYNAEHIPGSKNMHHRAITQESTSSWDKSYLYVTYCNGVGCNASTKGALNLSRLGFKVKELIGGIEKWKEDGYTIEGTHAPLNTVAQV